MREREEKSGNYSEQGIEACEREDGDEVKEDRGKERERERERENERTREKEREKEGVKELDRARNDRD